MMDDDDFGFTLEDAETIIEKAPKTNKKVKEKMQQLEKLILPFLENLLKNPEKEYIHWPNRTEVIKSQIDKITKITRSF
jgi:hypothetical protein